MSRVLRLVQSALDDDVDISVSGAPVLEDLGGCPVCLSVALLGMAGLAASALQTEGNPKDALIADLDRRLAELLDELDEERDD
jgi:hypothetical protein